MAMNEMKDENDSYLKPGQKDENDSYVGTMPVKSVRPKPGVPIRPIPIKPKPMPKTPSLGSTPAEAKKFVQPIPLGRKLTPKGPDAKKKMDMKMRDGLVAPGKENRMSAKQNSLRKSLEKAIKVGGNMRNNTSMAKKKF